MFQNSLTYKLDFHEMIFLLYINIYNCHSYTQDKPQPLAVIPVLHPELHIARKNDVLMLVPNKDALVNTAVKFIPKKKNLFEIAFVQDNSLLCFSKSKRLIKCEKEDAKGALWKIKRKFGDDGWRIKSDKETGFWFWNKEWCIEIDDEKQFTIAVCDKKDEKQRFKIKNFVEAVKEAATPGEEEKSSESQSDIAASEDSISSENEDGDDMTGIQKRDLEYENNKTELQSQLEKLSDKDLDKMQAGDLLAITNNSNEPLLGTQASPASDLQPGQQSSFDLEKTKNLIEDQTAAIPPALMTAPDSGSEAAELPENLIGGSFGIRSADHKFNTSKVSPDKSIDAMFGISENPNSINYNPMKAAALKIYIGVDKFLGKKFGKDLEVICKEDLCDRDENVETLDEDIANPSIIQAEALADDRETDV